MCGYRPSPTQEWVGGEKVRLQNGVLGNGWNVTVTKCPAGNGIRHEGGVGQVIAGMPGGGGGGWVGVGPPPVWKKAGVTTPAQYCRPMVSPVVVSRSCVHGTGIHAIPATTFTYKLAEWSPVTYVCHQGR